jgi:transmembrane protein 216
MPTDTAAQATSASLPLQLLAILSAIFCPMWFILTLALLIYKATFLIYPDAALGLEITGCLLVWLVEIGAVKLVKKGNLTENVTFLGAGLGLKLVTCIGAIYYMWLQVYVMRLDVGFSATLLTMDALAVLLGAATIQSITANASRQLNTAVAVQQTKQKSD